MPSARQRRAGGGNGWIGGTRYGRIARGGQDMVTPAKPQAKIRGLWVWIGLALMFLVTSLWRNDGPRSALWFAELPLYALMIGALLWRGVAGLGWRPSRRLAPIVFVGLSWAFGMIYEASLSVDGTGIGGVHPDTRASYLLAQGDYILIAVASWIMVRLFHLDFHGMFHFAAGKSLTEGLIFTGVLTAVLMSAQVWAAPFVQAYYALAYAAFVALPLLIIAPDTLWRQGSPAGRPGILVLWIAGFCIAFAIRVIWGLGWAPLATWIWDLPPNLPEL